MQVERAAGHTPLADEVARKLWSISGPCVGCKDCRGLCASFIEAMTIPDIILKANRS